MHPDQTQPLQQEAGKPADYGNASNPSPHADTAPAGQQLLDERAEKYLREVASPEDYPDAEDEQQMNKTIEQARNESSD